LAFIWPPGNDEVVICTGFAAAAVIPILKFFDALCFGELESLTCAVKEAVPDCVGVPLICPAEDNAKPVGNEPEEIDQL
jgi:hypothetical protein